MTAMEDKYVSAGHGGRYNPTDNSFINDDTSHKKSQLKQVHDETIYGINETHDGLQIQIQENTIERKNETLTYGRHSKKTPIVSN